MKIGDKVICIKSGKHRGLIEGKEYTLIKVLDRLVSVLDGCNSVELFFNKDRFKLKEKEMTQQEAIRLMLEGKTLIRAGGGSELFMENRTDNKIRFMVNINNTIIEEIDGAWHVVKDFKLKETRTIVLDGKKIEISEESFEEFKKQFKE